MNHRIAIMAGAVLALTLAACATPQPTPPAGGAPIAISPATQGQLASYLRKVKATRPGAFAVSTDGLNSFYTWCDDTACMTYNYSIPALRGCQGLAGQACVVLYVRNQPRLAFTRAAGAAADSTTGGQHGSQEQQRIDFDTGRR